MQTTFREWNNEEHSHQPAMRSTFVRNEARSSDSYFPSALEAADGVLNLALYIVGLPSDSSLASPTVLPTTSLTAPLISFADPTARCLPIISA
jgi:hypothetical protein